MIHYKKTKKFIIIICLYLITFILGLIIPKKKNLVIISASKGRFFNGNAKALHKHIQSQPCNLESYFFISNKNTFEEISKSEKNIIYQYSLKGLRLYLQAKTICITHGLADFLGFPILPSQTWILLGHGIGTKALGYLKPQISFKEKIELLFTKLFTYTITSDFDKYMFCAMNHVKPKNIFITGYPRNDALFKTQEKNKLKKISKILYAPTYRQEGITKLFPFQDFSPENLSKTLQKFEIELGIRFHPNNYKDSKHEIKSLLMLPNIEDKSPDVISDVQDILPKTDILITDFSSISRDFLFLDRPMIFIMNGIDTLGKLALPIRKEFAFCGYQVESYKELETALIEILEGKDRYKEVRRFVRDLSYNHIDAKSSHRVAELIKKLS